MIATCRPRVSLGPIFSLILSVPICVAISLAITIRMSVRQCLLWFAPAAATRRMNHESVSSLHLDEATGATLDPAVAAVLLFPRPEVDSKGAILAALHTERLPDSVLGYDGEREGNTALEGADDSIASVPFTASSTASSDREFSDKNGEAPFQQLDVGCAGVLCLMSTMASVCWSAGLRTVM